MGLSASGLVPWEVTEALKDREKIAQSEIVAVIPAPSEAPAGFSKLLMVNMF